MLRKCYYFLLSALIVPFNLTSCNKVRNINAEERSKRLKLIEKAQDNSYQLTISQFRGLNYWKVELYFWNSNGNLYQLNLINKDLSPNFIKISGDGNDTPPKAGEVQCKDPECRVKEAQLDLDHLRSILTTDRTPANTNYTTASKKEKYLKVYSREDKDHYDLEIWDSQNKLRVSKSKIKVVLFSYDEHEEETLSYVQMGEELQGRVVLNFERSDFMVPAIHTENLSFHLKTITISGVQAEDLPFLSSSSMKVNPCNTVQDSNGTRAQVKSVASVQEAPGLEVLDWCGSFLAFDLPSQEYQEFKIKFSRKKSE